MSDLFHKIEGEAVVLRSKGLFHQTDLYIRKDVVYAKKGSGYVRLISDGRTSHPDTFWEYVSVDIEVGPFGHLTLGVQP